MAVLAFAGFAISVASAHASTSYYVDVRSPNGAAAFIGEVTFVRANNFSFSGQLKDTACNSRDVVLEVWVNRRYWWEHPWLGTNWAGKRMVRSYRNSGGCGTSRTVSSEYTDAYFDDFDVAFKVCDDGSTDSCSSSKWPNEWYGVYRNPYAR